MLCQDSFSENVVLALEQAFHNPARKLTKSRGKNIHRFASAKMGKRVTVESALECDVCYCFDFEKDIIRFCAQPIRYSYYYNGKWRTYVPDFLVQFDTGEYVLYEVKPDNIASSSDFLDEWNAKQQAAQTRGLELELVEEKQIRVKNLLKNLKLMHRYASRDCLSDKHNLVLNILRKNGSQSAQYLSDKTGLSRRAIMPVLCNLLSRNLLETDLDTPISFQSEFELVSYD
ncbi:TnsA endonuclease N-terminal domain-containing protein [Vibrio antiquarius]|uniref:TnsA endonuclease N-terminal domain-containing protein n=1 Tax=Vibrio antiquarius (strain Ex25) TaxID=150340 RepID=UPI0026595DD7|nr:TnsA endonuclease N-terminal domain-containing protein [Vibrio antiquarius]MCR9967356.1 TnsA endonuclease N-terminal domain-containing protein [Vibrio antiquarius]